MPRCNKKEKEYLLGIKPKRYTENIFIDGTHNITVSLNSTQIDQYTVKPGDDLDLNIVYGTSIIESVTDNGKKVLCLVAYDDNNDRNYIKYSLTNIASSHSINVVANNDVQKHSLSDTRKITTKKTAHIGYSSEGHAVTASINTKFPNFSIPSDAVIVDVDCQANTSFTNACDGSPTTNRKIEFDSQGSVTFNNGTCYLCSYIYINSLKPSYFNSGAGISMSAGRYTNTDVCYNGADINLNSAQLDVKYVPKGNLYFIFSEQSGSGYGKISKRVFFTESGHSFQYCAKPNEGYHIESVTLDDEPITLSEDGTYLLSNINDNHTFNVVFEQDVWIL